MTTMLSDAPSQDRRAHSLRPICIDAAEAHARGWVTYEPDATAVVDCEPLTPATGKPVMRATPDRQYPAVRATFDDLNKALSSLANSPRAEGGKTLRQLYDEEVERYEQLVAQAQAEGRLEPDYGTYVLDHARGDLYLVAPERWHRLALVTSNS